MSIQLTANPTPQKAAILAITSVVRYFQMENPCDLSANLQPSSEIPMGPFINLNKFVDAEVEKEKTAALLEIDKKAFSDDWQISAKRTIAKFKGHLKSCLSAIGHASCYAESLADFALLEGQFTFLMEWRLHVTAYYQRPNYIQVRIDGSEIPEVDSPIWQIKNYAEMVRISLQRVMLYEPLSTQEEKIKLTPVQGEVLKILRHQPRGVGISSPKIVIELKKTRHKIVAATVRRHVMPILKKQFGVDHSKSKGGFFLPE